MGCLGSPRLSFVLGSTIWEAFPFLQIHKSKVSLLLFKLLLDFDSISIRRAEQGDVQELQLVLDVFV